MSALTHYIVVRRDLPFGVILASVAHAAGESFYQCPRSSVKEHLVANQEVGGLSPSGGSLFDPAQTVAVVLGARNESKLRGFGARVLMAKIPHVFIHETEGAFAGQLMAVGLVPGDRDHLRRHVNEFQMFKEFTQET